MRNFHPGKHRSQGLSLNSFTDDELYDIHLATLEVLEKTGLYIETDCPFEPGSNISIKMISPLGDPNEKAYHMRDGQVIWCKQVGDSTSRFGIGIKILRKVVEAEVLTSRFR